VKPATDLWRRKLVFRSYLVLVAGLLVTATVLDAGFAYLEERLSPSEDAWLERSFGLIEAELAATPRAERTAVATRLGREIGVDVRILEHGDVVAAAAADGAIARLAGDAGELSLVKAAPSIDASILLGPIDRERDSIALRLLPPLFYVCVFVVVGLWLRPLLRDLNLITSATRRFAADYREPISTAKNTTQLTGLAQDLDEMSGRLSSLIQSHKELAAALSHEMRTPLARIRFALAVIRHDASPDVQRQLDAIGVDLEEIDGLVAAILTYARLDHPDLRMSWELTPLGAWLEETLAKCVEPSKELEVVCAATLESVWMDPRLMALAASNLVVNAHRYARTKVRLEIRRDASGYALTVEDDGDGVPETARAAIFKPFARLDTARNRENPGHGLGLAIVARVAALHGGAVDVESSRILGGARFTVAWPERRAGVR
jgi:signal transduction histidine kinase